MSPREQPDIVDRLRDSDVPATMSFREEAAKEIVDLRLKVVRASLDAHHCLQSARDLHALLAQWHELQANSSRTNREQREHYELALRLRCAMASLPDVPPAFPKTRATIAAMIREAMPAEAPPDGSWPGHRRDCEFARSDGHLVCTCGFFNSPHAPKV